MILGNPCVYESFWGRLSRETVGTAVLMRPEGIDSTISTAEPEQ